MLAELVSNFQVRTRANHVSLLKTCYTPVFLCFHVVYIEADLDHAVETENDQGSAGTARDQILLKLRISRILQELRGTRMLLKLRMTIVLL
jgi:hypothetical protein